MALTSEFALTCTETQNETRQNADDLEVGQACPHQTRNCGKTCRSRPLKLSGDLQNEP
jgi:hypothetical protein